MKRFVVLAAAAAIVLPSVRASASGFLAARFGGEHGHPTTSNPTALYYNPAGLALATGTRLYLSGTFAYRTASYDRPSDVIDNIGTPGTPEDAVDANSGEATLANFLVSPFAAVTSDLGIENLGVGLGFYAPFGGQSEWDKNDKYRGNDAYPGAVDGPQRWWSIDGTIRALYFTAGGAYRIPDLRLSLGVGVNLVKSEVNTGRARNSNGSDDMVTDTGALQEGRSLIDASGWSLGLGAGVIWEPVENLFVGLSYQSQPGFGEQSLEGTLKTALGTGPADEEDIELRQALPDVVRLGLRYRTLPWEYRLFGEYVRWSVFERQCLVSAGSPACDLAPDGAARSDGIILNIPRDWHDSWGLRGGVSHWFSENVEVFLGAGYDGNAASDEGLDAALIDMPKVTGALGGRFALLDGVLAIQPTLTQVYYFERTIENPKRFAPPSRTPDNSGVYNQSVTTLDLAVEYTF